ncbi:sugar transferase [Candidatus Omnitrophota bacterium]
MKHLLRTPNSRKKLMIFVGDVILITLTLAGVAFLCHYFKENATFTILRRPLKFYPLYISSVLYLAMLYMFEMHDIRQRREDLHGFASLSIVTFISFLAMFALAKVLQINQTTMITLFVFHLVAIFLLYSWRMIFIKRFVASDYFIKKVLFIGQDILTEAILNEMKKTDYRPLGFADLEAPEFGGLKRRLKFVGTTRDLGYLIDSQKIQVAVTSLGKDLPLGVIKEIYKYKFEGIEVYDSAYFYEVLTRKVAIKPYLDGDFVPFLSIDAFLNPVFCNEKRFIDFFGALFLFIATLPLTLVISILVRCTSRGPVFYFQERLGFQERPFKLIKFRTMVVGAESEDGPRWASKGDQRVTKLGKFLRMTRLDELPQLINILKGDISFVGPRPIRKHFSDVIEGKVPFYSLRFTVKPGLTGWAQVNYEYGGSVEGHMEKFQYDLYYIKHASFFLDLFIILKTPQTIIRRPAW